MSSKFFVTLTSCSRVIVGTVLFPLLFSFHSTKHIHDSFLCLPSKILDILSSWSLDRIISLKTSRFLKNRE
ncbi:hypothetical protein DL95DRAFT_155599 [Leptodontidium sp. 2 PMI_412]|nr:hypothetical protein DL95DRAFT_155599 [Leptodontidium sp. 2 PMI_412]